MSDIGISKAPFRIVSERQRYEKNIKLDLVVDLRETYKLSPLTLEIKPSMPQLAQ